MRKNNRCPACGRIQKKSHDKKVLSGKPYVKGCKIYNPNPEKVWRDYKRNI